MFFFVWTRMPFFIGCVEQATFHDDHDECVYHLLVWDGMVDVLGVHHVNIYLGDQFSSPSVGVHTTSWSLH